MPSASDAHSLGVATCASSLCHGSVKPWQGSHVLQTEYVTWLHQDKHARAYALLLQPRSQAMAKKFGLRVPAQQAPACLDCHAHNVPTAQRDARFDVSDGVSCEACHGPAERWLASHVAPNATHAHSVASGMYPLEDATARAALCLSCHEGNADKRVTHRLMAAGHPRLSFELDTFSAIAPAHYQIDDDYRARKPNAADGVNVWAIGQALSVAELMTALADPKRGRDGLFPELVLFDCHACHHPMTQQRWQPRPGLVAGPGQVRINDSGILMLQAIAQQVDQVLAQRIAARLASLHRAAAGQGDAYAEANAMAKLAQDLASRLQQQPLPALALRAVALGLIDAGSRGSYSDYAGAEQAAMAMGSVMAAMQRRGQLSDAAEVNQALAIINAALADAERYQPKQFQSGLDRLRRQLVKQP